MEYKIKILLVFLAAILLHSSIFSQNLSVHDPAMQYLFEDTLLKNENFHSLFRPVEVSWRWYDSIMNSTNKNNLKSVRLSPVLDILTTYDKKDDQFLVHLGQGVYASGNIGRKTGFEVSASLVEEKFAGTNAVILDSLKLVPGHNRYLWKSGSSAGYLSVRGSMYWQPVRWIRFKAGNDKQFIGDGIRSLFLSENAAAYPFFQTHVKMWHISYEHQVMFLRDLVPDSGSTRYSKYVSMHTLSYNASRKLNFYVFEAVIWRNQDSLRRRTFDVTYLNPFIFFRPVEFNIGSPDNVLMGVGGKWILGKQSCFYGQVLIDEFRLKELEANTGWWSNKYAYQFGFKTYSLLKNHPSVFSIEYNQCRPFTYSHSYTLQNYGYLDRPLAHPQGSNFREAAASFGMAFQPRWFVYLSGNLTEYGSDPPGKNYGSDIYKKQWTFSKAFGNTTGQGISHKEVNLNFSLSRMIKPEWRLRFFTSLQSLAYRKEGKMNLQPAVTVGISTWTNE